MITQDSRCLYKRGEPIREAEGRLRTSFTVPGKGRGEKVWRGLGMGRGGVNGRAEGKERGKGQDSGWVLQGVSRHN